MFTRLVGVLLFAFAYTLVRYAVFGGVSPVHIPVYLLNKTISMAAVIFLAFAAMAHYSSKGERAKFWGSACWHCTCLHVLLSLAILRPDYFPKFFGAEKMNLIGETTILFGVVALYGFWRLGGNGLSFDHRRGLLLISTFLIGGHVTAMGFQGWIDVASWHGGLPPISLLSLLAVLGSFAQFLRTPRGATKNS